MLSIIKIHFIRVCFNQSFLNVVFIRVFFDPVNDVMLPMLFQHPLTAQPLLVRVAMPCLCNHWGAEVFRNGHARDCHTGHDGEGKDALSQMVLLYIKHPYQLLLFPLSYTMQRKAAGNSKGKCGFFAKSFSENRDFRGRQMQNPRSFLCCRFSLPSLHPVRESRYKVHYALALQGRSLGCAAEALHQRGENHHEGNQNQGLHHRRA